jgi:hypothetical protein
VANPARIWRIDALKGLLTRRRAVSKSVGPQTVTGLLASQNEPLFPTGPLIMTAQGLTTPNELRYAMYSEQVKH